MKDRRSNGTQERVAGGTPETREIALQQGLKLIGSPWVHQLWVHIRHRQCKTLTLPHSLFDTYVEAK